jgi:hypothetical protein
MQRQLGVQQKSRRDDISVARKQADAIKKSRQDDISVEENNTCLLSMIKGIDKTSFSPYLKNKTTLVAGIYQSIIQPHYLIKSMIFWSKFNEAIRLFLCDIPLLLRLFCWGNKVKIRFHFSMFEHPALQDLIDDVIVHPYKIDGKLEILKIELVNKI